MIMEKKEETHESEDEDTQDVHNRKSLSSALAPGNGNRG